MIQLYLYGVVVFVVDVYFGYIVEYCEVVYQVVFGEVGEFLGGQGVVVECYLDDWLGVGVVFCDYWCFGFFW